MIKVKYFWIAQMLAVAITAGSAFTFTGCNGTNNAGDRLVLALRSGIYAEVIKECLPDFEKEYGIECKVMEFSEDDLYNSIYSDSANYSGAYDLCMVDGSWMAGFMAENVLTSLSGMGYQFDDDIIPATTSVCYSDDQIFLVPYYGNVTVLLYNQNRLKEIGYSSSDINCLEDVVNISLSAQDAGMDGFLYRGDTENNIVVDFLPVLCAYGGWVIDSSGTPSVDTDEFHLAMEQYLKLIKTGRACIKEEVISSVEEGSALFAVGWPGWCTPADDVATYYCPIPGKISETSESYNCNVYGIWTMGIPANSNNKGLAYNLLSYLMDPEVQKSTIDNGGVPCRYSCLKDENIVSKAPYLSVICDALENGIYRPVIKEWTDFYTILGAVMRDIIDGRYNVDDGLKIAQSNLETLMGK